MLLDLHSAKLRQGELDLEMLEAECSTRDRLIGVLDDLNQRYGRGTLKLASAGIEAKGERATWAMRQERRSPLWTARHPSVSAKIDVAPLAFHSLREALAYIQTNLPADECVPLVVKNPRVIERDWSYGQKFV